MKLNSSLRGTITMREAAGGHRAVIAEQNAGAQEGTVNCLMINSKLTSRFNDLVGLKGHYGCERVTAGVR